jgi:hypothetical protein
VTRMQVNWSRGLYRAWLVLALGWVGFIGWYEYANKPWNLDWGSSALIRTENDECWTRLAKWPDGQPFDWWDIAGDEADFAENVEINKKKGAWRADEIPARNRWVAQIRQKLIDCEAAAPLVQRLSRQAINIWDSLKDDIALIFLPPIALLITGWIIGWIAKGFRESTKPL